MGEKFSNNSSFNTDPSEDFSDLRRKKIHLEYLNKFRFERDPFSDNPQSGLFFPGAGRQQTIQSILHYSRYGSTPVFLTGAAGSGKTTVLFAAIREILDDVDIVSIEAEIMMTEQKLFSLISQGMGILNENDCVNEIVGVVEANTALGRQSLLCIDNIEELSEEVLLSLFELIVMCNGQLNTILSGQEQSADLLLEIAKASNLLINRLNLSPLSETEVYDYICYKLDAIGYEDDFPFSSIQLKALTLRSQGSIKQLHSIARSMLMASAVDIQPKNKGFPLGHLFLLFFLLGFIGLIYQQNNVQNLTEKNEPITLEKSQKNFYAQSSEEDPIKYENNFPSDQSKISEDVVTEITLDQVDEVKIQFDETVKIVPKSYFKEQILSWNSTQYVLQIFGTHDFRKAKELLKDFEEQVELIIYETRYNGKPWFVVINGPYSDRDIARSSVKNFPEKVRKLRPWPRNVASIQADVERYDSLVDPIQ